MPLFGTKQQEPDLPKRVWVLGEMLEVLGPADWKRISETHAAATRVDGGADFRAFELATQRSVPPDLLNWRLAQVGVVMRTKTPGLQEYLGLTAIAAGQSPVDPDEAERLSHFLFAVLVAVMANRPTDLPGFERAYAAFEPWVPLASLLSVREG